MPIPVIPVVMRDGTISSGTLQYADGIPRCVDAVPLSDMIADIAERFGRGNPVLMVDTDNISARTLDPMLLKKLKSRKVRIWLMTSVMDVDDMFDAFFSNIDMLVMPHHMIRDDSDLNEMHSLSDRCMPMIVMRDGVPKEGGSPLSAMRNIMRHGYARIGVMETTGKFDRTLWEQIADVNPKTIPYIHGCDPQTVQELAGMFNETFMDQQASYRIPEPL